MKQSEIKLLSLEELKERIVTLKTNYQSLKRAHAITPLENPLQLRKIRRDIARLSFELNNRQLQ